MENRGPLVCSVSQGLQPQLLTLYTRGGRRTVNLRWKFRTEVRLWKTKISRRFQAFPVFTKYRDRQCGLNFSSPARLRERVHNALQYIQTATPVTHVHLLGVNLTCTTSIVALQRLASTYFVYIIHTNGSSAVYACCCCCCCLPIKNRSDLSLPNTFICPYCSNT